MSIEAESQLENTLQDRRLPGVSNKKILVVDDELDIRNLLQMIFTNEGYTVLLAKNGEEGIHVARTESPDVIFLDLLMSGLSGLEVCKILKGNPVTEGIPIVVVTAFGRDSDIQLAKEAGADWFVKKPFDNKQLIELASKLFYDDKMAAGSSVKFSSEMTPQTYLLSLSHAFIDETMKLFPNGLNTKMQESYFKALSRFFNLPVQVDNFERVPLEDLGRIFNLPALAEDSESVPLDAVKTKFIDVLNKMGLADRFMLVEDPDMYIFQVIGCKHAGTYHGSIQSSSFLCPHALFVGALIHTYVNPKIQVSKTVLKKGGSITVYRKLNPLTVKKYITKTG